MVIESYFLATVEEIETGVLISVFLVFFFFRFSLFFGLLSPISSSYVQIKKFGYGLAGLATLTKIGFPLKFKGNHSLRLTLKAEEIKD